MMKVVGIIPARFGSTRFPGKPLVELKGKSMIQRVYEQCIQAQGFSEIIVATDNQRIFNHVESFGGKVVFTSPNHPTGTDRCAQVCRELGYEVDVVVNIQGDEPLIDPQQLELVAQAFQSEACDIATLVKRIENPEFLNDPSKIKVVRNQKNEALYFSRQSIPYHRNEHSDASDKPTYWLHIGIYGYRSRVLNTLGKLSPTPLEKAEQLEQLRWLEHGYRIHVRETTHQSLAIDVPSDVDRVIALLNE